MKQLGEIKVANRANSLTIDIDGIIGVPEWWQFEHEEDRVATYEKFRQSLETIRQCEAPRIRVNIRSVGGNVQDALLIYDVLGELIGQGAEVTTSCHGYVASAATVVAQAASAGRRWVSSNALYLVHNATLQTEGNSGEMERACELLSKTDQRIAAIYARHSGRSEEEFRALMGRDSGRGEWLSPEETVEAGLADRIQESSPLREAGRRVKDLFSRSAVAMNRLLEEPLPEAAASSEVVHTLRAEVSELQRRLAELQSENAQLAARPTATLPKEDPAIESLLDASAQRPNGESYSADALHLRTVRS